MSDHADIDAFIDAAAPVVGIEIPQASRADVRTNLEIAMNMARLLEGFPLDERTEPAPVFTP
ncbi:MAG: hypothetical protein JWN93_1200 [Hyphomicrobiales bacterium]|jgi:hypothetical protein|nr:hypothetical protein [Hyphomicrobiales bacterium]